MRERLPARIKRHFERFFKHFIEADRDVFFNRGEGRPFAHVKKRLNNSVGRRPAEVGEFLRV